MAERTGKHTLFAAALLAIHPDVSCWQCLLQTQSRECASTLDEYINFKLLIKSATVTGPGMLTVSVISMPLDLKQFVLLNGHYTWINLGYVTLQQRSHPQMHPSGLLEAQPTEQAKMSTSSQAAYSAVFPLSQTLPPGAAVQLSGRRQAAQGMHNYAVSEAFLMYLLDPTAGDQQAMAFTPFTDSLPCVLSLYPQAMPMCSAMSHPPSSTNSHITEQPPTASTAQLYASYATLPWLLCIALLGTTIALVINNRGSNLELSSISPQASKQDTESGFCIKSKLPEVTPTKDTGCSPFVPVTQAAMPPPTFHGHLPPSCSSKIGSYRVTPRGARQTASRALTTQTNTSGRTKWQRDRNGRLASLAAQEDDSTADEFTSSRAKL